MATHETSPDPEFVPTLRPHGVTTLDILGFAALLVLSPIATQLVYFKVDHPAVLVGHALVVVGGLGLRRLSATARSHTAGVCEHLSRANGVEIHPSDLRQAIRTHPKPHRFWRGAERVQLSIERIDGQDVWQWEKVADDSLPPA